MIPTGRHEKSELPSAMARDSGDGGLVVLGLGNPIITDDAVGLRVVEQVQELLLRDPVPGVEILLSTRAGFELIDLLTGFRHAVIVDCLNLPHSTPGRIRHLQLDDLVGCTRLNCIHEINIGTAFELARQLDIAMPHAVDIFAVEVADTVTLSETMTPAVEAVVAPLAGELHRLLKNLAGSVTVRPPGEAPGTRTARAFYQP
ncbi:hydrogenase maturation protease [bacterium]|nr:hydrogenase maturation protease [candidate division CSSED10-310 bacterium]